MTVNTSKLPLSITSFSSIRNKDLVYVDKTRMIYELTQSNAPIFLSRPRRFGKSLLVSTFESLFTKGLEDFKGLEIEKLWKEDKTYPVMRFDFSMISGETAELFKRNFARKLKGIIGEFGFYSNSDDFDQVISDFSLWLRKEPENKYVLLIDEYDSPLTKFLNQSEEFKSTLSALSEFYATIKGYRDVFRFIFITGIARFQKASIFSVMNNIDDISLSTTYGTITGYTQEELEKYFKPYLDNAAKVLNMSRKELLERMAEQYDGFCFDRQGKYRLYSPWSVLKFLTRPQEGFLNYWSDSSGSQRLILDYFTDHAITSLKEFDKEQVLDKSDLSDLFTLDTINPLALLTQAGYFTIDHEEGDYFYLRYPNGEVRQSMAKEYKKVIYKNDQAGSILLGKVVGAIRNLNPEAIIEVFNQILLNIPHGTNYPLDSEEAVRAYMLFVLLCQNILAIGEKATAGGRSDIVAVYKENCLVLELKYCRDKTGDPKEKAEVALKDAVDQIIDRQYGKEIFGKNLLRLALVFSESKRQFVRWQKVD